MDQNNNPILLFSEAISYCHIVRPLIVGRWLKELNRPITVVCHPRARDLFIAEGYQVKTASMADPVKIYSRLARGSYIYEESDLINYYCEDRQLIEEIKPTLIVADFRFTLLHLAGEAQIPAVGISSVSCHPFFPLDGTTPNPFVKTPLIPVKLLDYLQGTAFGRLVRAQVIKEISKPYRSASLKSRLRPLGTFFDYASQGSLCLLCDHPDIMPLPSLRAQDYYAGALVWERDEELPAVLKNLDKSIKTIYITVGTQESLRLDFLDDLVNALLRLGVRIIVSRGGRDFKIGLQHENLMLFDFLNESKLLPNIDLYICHGSAMSIYQGLFFGIPMIAIPCQADQHYHSEALLRLRVGKLVRPINLKARAVAKLASDLIMDQDLKDRCRQLSAKVQGYSGKEGFLRRVKKLLPVP